jgi:hypothetical protein
VNGFSGHLAGSVSSLVFVLSFIACSASPEQRQPSRVETAFNGFDQFQDSVVRSDPFTRIVASKIHERYRAQFSSYQTSTAVAKLEPEDVALLFRAAGADFLYSVSPASLGDMQLDLAELRRRGIARRDNDEKVYAALVESRLFDEARAFAKQHRLASVETVPDVVDEAVRKGPTTLLVRMAARSSYESQSTLAKVDSLSSSHRRSVIFCQRAIRSIESDALLRPLIRDNALWIVPPDQSTPFATVATWNRLHPHEQMAFVYRREEWPMVERWETPVFYFLKDGRVVSIVRGWPVAGRKAEIRRSLRLAGFM